MSIEMFKQVFKTSNFLLVSLALLITANVVFAQQRSPTRTEAIRFLKKTDETLRTEFQNSAHAYWLASNFIGYDSQKLAAAAGEKNSLLLAKLAKQAARYNNLRMKTKYRRQLDALIKGQTLPSPDNPKLAKELSELSTELEAMYGAGKYCSDPDNASTCKGLGDFEQVIDNVKLEYSADQLQQAWMGWRTVSPPMREKYMRMIEIGNMGAKELGHADLGVLWRSGYDMEPEAFSGELERLWNQVKPLYSSLHCHVRAKLEDHYGDEVIQDDGLIPAHLLGNMWSQTWSNIYPLVAPPSVDIGYDLTSIIQARYPEREDGEPDMEGAIELVKIGEEFFTSLGFDALPDTFYERSLFLKPRDRDVVCHASAWTLDSVEDVRIKMCIEKNEEDFQTIHHELGHIFYDLEYNHHPLLLQGGAHDGFHEAVGDVLGLSITPNYLKELGFIDQVPPPEADLALLMKLALDKIAFLPFGLLMDQWRWKVFSGEVSEDKLNESWWQMRTKYQGIKPPVARSEMHFDPGAKYHIPGNTPYTRYFLSFIMQFQLHEALCKAASFDGPLSRCTIYGNKVAGEKLIDMLSQGASRPWPETLSIVTGEEKMDGSAIIRYFKPLLKWLDEQNRGRSCGWDTNMSKLAQN